MNSMENEKLCLYRNLVEGLKKIPKYLHWFFQLLKVENKTGNSPPQPNGLKKPSDFSVSLCLSICLSICLFVYLSIGPSYCVSHSICLFFSSLSFHHSIFECFDPSVFLSLFLSLHLSFLLTLLYLYFLSFNLTICLFSATLSINLSSIF